MEDNNDTGAVFLDLAKTVNSISHEIFLKKAENFNLSQSTILLLKSFLENRTQCVKLGIDLSDKITINHGVMSPNFLKSWKVKMMLFNLRMTLVLYANLEVMKIFPNKLKKIRTNRQIPDRESTHFKYR